MFEVQDEQMHKPMLQREQQMLHRCVQMCLLPDPGKAWLMALLAAFYFVLTMGNMRQAWVSTSVCIHYVTEPIR